MARSEKTIALVNNLGVVPVVAYTVPLSTKTIVTGISACNVTSSTAAFTLIVTRLGVDYSFFSASPVPGNDFLMFSGHLVLDAAGDTISVVSDTATSFDVIISGWENT